MTPLKGTCMYCCTPLFDTEPSYHTQSLQLSPTEPSYHPHLCVPRIYESIGYDSNDTVEVGQNQTQSSFFVSLPWLQPVALLQTDSFFDYEGSAGKYVVRCTRLTFP